MERGPHLLLLPGRGGLLRRWLPVGLLRRLRRLARARRRAVVDALQVCADLLLACRDGAQVEHDDDAAVLHGVADVLIEPNDAELLELPESGDTPLKMAWVCRIVEQHAGQRPK